MLAATTTSSTTNSPRAADAVPEHAAAPNGHTILVVDDETPTLLLMRFLFRREGHIVLTAASAEEAISLLERNAVALAIVDQRLPDRLGTDLLRLIRQSWPDTFRVLFTAYADLDTAVRAINDGHVFHYLTKPWDNNALREVVREGLRRYDLTRENRRLGARVLRQTTELRRANETLEQKVAEHAAELEIKNRELEGTLLDVVRTLNGLLEMRGIGPKGHAFHVRQGCDWVAQRLDLPPDERLEISMAAMLHDIGKVSLPDELLRKDPFLHTRLEAAMYREHPLLGQSILAGIRSLENVGRIIRHQGEWYNGAGYPAGLVGEQIPMGSRIISAVDRYEEQREREVLEQGIGRRFDPRVVAALFDYFAEQVESRREEAVRLLAPHELRVGMVLMNDVYTGRGLFLVGGGKVVDRPTLEKIRNFNRVDPITGKIYVQG